MKKNLAPQRFFTSTHARLVLLAVLLAVITSSDVLAQGTLIDNGSSTNRWLLHNPNDSRKSLFIAPEFNSGGWNWSNGTTFNSNGEVYIARGLGINNNTPGLGGFRLIVNGSALVERLSVSKPTGADFVFKEDYPLPSLTDVESYIKLHSHLPEIASADEMKAEGLELGTFTIKLLQKIEELTLYTIEQERRIQALEEKQNTSQSSVHEKQYSPSN